MCGIVGLINRNRPISIDDRSNVARVLEKLSYRGPDGAGIWDSGKVIFGHRRLSIVDLSSAGAQPFVDPDRKLSITFNGEIYNYLEIRQALLAKGYEFRSNSDTEVLLLAYDCYGMDFLSYLRGMFAFCLFDEIKGVALLSRDPMGEKPLYYYLNGDKLVFASECKAFHAFRDIELAIDEESVKAFLVLQYIPGTHTAYRHIQRIPPGVAIKIDLNNWNITQWKYWNFGEAISQSRSFDVDIDGMISRSVREKLIADVEVGLLLSGGIDSTLIAWYAKQENENVRAFSARFERTDLDELEYSSQVSAHLGLNQVVIDGGGLDCDVFDKVIFHADEFLGDPACIPTYLLAREISKHVKVVLSGEGADELFWGYDTYRYERWWHWLAWIRPLFRHSTVLKTLASTFESSPKIPAGMTRFFKLITDPYELGASRWTSVFSYNTLSRLFAHDLERSGSLYLAEMEEDVLRNINRSNWLENSLAIDLRHWLPNDLLIKVDRMTMAHSVEARAPFLDPELVQAATAMPVRQKMDFYRGKLILRKKIEDHFPETMGQVLANRKKHGFEVPIRDWLFVTLREQVEERLSQKAVKQSGFFDAEYVSQLWRSFCDAPDDSPLQRKIWLIFCFQSWYAVHKSKFGF
ncbi:MAG TPA: asparagine synthase (glutamine-hydrolyzing) [Anaerolineae bacterium]|nr:asparagine synthase (glutamine-hydrolyzing) [Anaerolineae bacterium]